MTQLCATPVEGGRKNFECRAAHAFSLCCGMLLILFNPCGALAVTFNFTPAAGMSQQAIDGFAEAGELWEAVLFDPITVNLDIDFANLGAGILGGTSSTFGNVSYPGFRTLLSADTISSDDLLATSSLPGGSTFDLYLNRTSNNPNGSGSATPYVDSDGDANNSTIWMTTANAKAIGALSANDPGTDASISFSNQFTWDFNPSNGISGGSLDFVGVAAHEIGHALGFVSGVDILDINSPPHNGPFADNIFTFVSPLDMFRYSNDSVLSGVIDWTADNRSKFFSIDGGTTSLTTFSTGKNFGDGRQASHWKDNLSIGIMDPTFAPGQLGVITTQDIQGFDVIGYDLVVTVPEPAALATMVFGLFLLAMAGSRRRNRR